MFSMKARTEFLLRRSSIIVTWPCLLPLERCLYISYNWFVLYFCLKSCSTKEQLPSTCVHLVIALMEDMNATLTATSFLQIVPRYVKKRKKKETFINKPGATHILHEAKLREFERFHQRIWLMPHHISN